MIKLKTAKKRFIGDGFDKEWCKRRESLFSSLFQATLTTSFHPAGEVEGIFRALIMISWRKGKISEKEGISVKHGGINFSKGVEVTKVTTGSEMGRVAREGIGRPGGKGRVGVMGEGEKVVGGGEGVC